MTEKIDHALVQHLLELYQAGIIEEDKREAVAIFKEILDHKLEGSTGQPQIDQEIFSIVMSTKHILGCKLYELGEIEEGIKFFHEAAIMGHAGSMYYLGVHYEAMNHASASKFFVRAAKLGHVKAMKAVQELGIDFLLDKNL